VHPDYFIHCTYINHVTYAVIVQKEGLSASHDNSCSYLKAELVDFDDLGRQRLVEDALGPPQAHGAQQHPKACEALGVALLDGPRDGAVEHLDVIERRRAHKGKQALDVLGLVLKRRAREAPPAATRSQETTRTNCACAIFHGGILMPLLIPLPLLEDISL
jgi:hypothetical protein